MKALLQRVSEARVAVDGQVLGEIGRGLVVLLGVAGGDEESDARVLAAKTARLRIFSDDQGKFNCSLLDTGGQALVVSQFTLMSNTRRGRRPSFDEAAEPGLAETLVRRFSQLLQNEGVPVESGRFGAHMLVTIQNDGPVTILLDSKELTKPRRSNGT